MRPRLGLRRRLLELSRRTLEEHGFYVVEKRYDAPIPDEGELGPEFWERESELVGIDMNEQAALTLAREVFSEYAAEFRELFPLHEEPRSRFHLVNGSFMAVDAHVYYALIRHFKPQRIIEVGAGYSTLVAAEAALRNEEEDGRRPELTAVDPYPASTLQDVPGLGRLIARKVQELDLELFASLSSGDIVFIDSSHVLRSGGDVQYEYCEILPRLAEGVLVHVHDISLPGHYPRVYFDSKLFWNEQYILQAFLTFNSRFEVLWPATYMTRRHGDVIAELFPELGEMRLVYPQSEPSSFWIRASRP